MNLEGKTVIVTGSSNGIGRETIIEFAKLECNVIINYNTDKESALKLEKEINNYGGKSLVIKCDISNELEVKNMIDSTIKKFGKIDILINNAGIAIDNDIYDKNKDEFMKVLEVNLVGTFLVTKEATKYMDNGVIINISSTDGIDTYNELSMDYCASKAGVISLTKTVALRFPNLKVYSIAPNWVKTKPVLEMNQEYLEQELKRIGQTRLIEPIEVAKKIIELINNPQESGKIVRIDGGYNV